MGGIVTQRTVRRIVRALGSKPKVTVEIINQVVASQPKEHARGTLGGRQSGEASMIKELPEEGIVVVRTTRRGHSLIKEALRDIQK